MQLPEKYLANMKLLREEDFDAYIRSFEEASLSGLRVNRNMISVEEFIKIAPFSIVPIPYIDNGFFINENDGWSKHPYYYAGLYYLQEPSAMLPANRLPVKKTDKVLDLCAAPGGKATELSSKTDTLLVANDISFSRTLPLVKNLEIAGNGNFLVVNEEPQKLARSFAGYFDKILVDAPCSGEGMFRKDSSLIKSWEDRGPEYYAPIQKSILEAAYDMLADGGMILYSTCTFSNVEDEDVILDFVNNHPDVTIEKISEYEGFSNCYRQYGDNYNKAENMIHVFPDKMQGEGHFLTLLRKNSGKESNRTINHKIDSSKLIPYSKLPEEVRTFMGFLNDGLRSEIESFRFMVKDKELVFMLNEEMTDAYNSSIHFVRTGIFVGTLNGKGGFVPHTAFARYLEKDDFKNVIDLPSKGDDILRYLKGETLVPEADALSKGYVLITTDDFPVGFAKYDGSRLKNLYEKGWRLQ